MSLKNTWYEEFILFKSNKANFLQVKKNKTYLGIQVQAGLNRFFPPVVKNISDELIGIKWKSPALFGIYLAVNCTRNHLYSYMYFKTRCPYSQYTKEVPSKKNEKKKKPSHSRRLFMPK